MIYRSTPKSSRQTQPTSVTINQFNICDSDFDNLANSEGDESDTDVNNDDGLESLEGSLGSDQEVSYSGDEVLDDDDIDQTEIKRGPQDNRWRLDKTFQSKESLDKFLAEESWWSYRSRNACKEGIKFLYRCNRVKRSSKNQCEAGNYVIESMKLDGRSESNETGDGNDDVRVTYLWYRKNAVHTHKRSPEYKQNVTDRVKK